MNDELEDMGFHDLRSLAAELDLDATGTADELRERIAESGAADEESGGAAGDPETALDAEPYPERLLYTDAPVSYDQGYVESEPTEHERDGRPVRRIVVGDVRGSDLRSLVDYQRDRYQAGMYLAMTQGEFDEWAGR